MTGFTDGAGQDGVYWGTVTVSGWIQPGSDTPSPIIPGEKFRDLYQARNPIDVVH